MQRFLLTLLILGLLGCSSKGKAQPAMARYLCQGSEVTTVLKKGSGPEHWRCGDTYRPNRGETLWELAQHPEEGGYLLRELFVPGTLSHLSHLTLSATGDPDSTWAIEVGVLARGKTKYRPVGTLTATARSLQVPREPGDELYVKVYGDPGRGLDRLGLTIAP